MSAFTTANLARVSRARGLTGVILSVLPLSLIWMAADALSIHSSLASAIAVASAAMAWLVVAWVVPDKFLNVGSMYAGLLFVFHGGLLIFSALSLDISFFNDNDGDWFHSPALAPAALAVAVGSASFSGGYALMALLRPVRMTPSTGTPHDARLETGQALLGLLLLSAGALMFLGTLLTTGVSLIGARYTEYLAATRTNSLVPTSYLLVGLGTALVAGLRESRLRRAGLTVFTVFAVPAMLIGLRGEVIMPMAVWVVMAARRRTIRPSWLHSAFFAAALSIGSAVRQVRQGGFDLGSLLKLSLSPLDGLIETGYSIRPVILVRTWIDLRHESPQGFESYLDPFERLVGGRLLGAPTLDAAVDPHAFLPVVARRAGEIGGSSIAEAYYAHRLLGVALVLSVLGILAYLLDRLPTTPVGNTMVGVMAIVLFMWIRNDSTALAGQMLVVAVVVGSVRVVNLAIKRRRRSVPYLVGLQP